MQNISLKEYHIRTLKKIGFRDQELSFFTPKQAEDTIRKYYKMSRNKRKEVHVAMRKG